MALGISAVEVRDEFAIGLELDGMTVGDRYTLYRDATLIRQWRASANREDFLDVLAPFGVQVVYTLQQVSPPELVKSEPVEIAYGPGPGWDVPAFDFVDASCPVFRVANDPDAKPFRMPVTDYEAEFGIRSVTMPVLGSPWPVVASDVLTAKQFTIVVLSASVAMRAGWLDLLRPSNTLHVRSPVVEGLGDVFFRVVGLKESVPVPERPLLREWSVECQQVARPASYGLQTWENGRRWRDVKRIGTWADVKAEGTWNDVLFGGDGEDLTDRPIGPGGIW